MKRKVEEIQRITYTITEAEVRELIKKNSYDIPVDGGGMSLCFSSGTTMERMEDGGYRICTEYVTEAKKPKPTEMPPNAKG